MRTLFSFVMCFVLALIAGHCPAQTPVFRKADSLFLAGDYSAARTWFEQALAAKPIPPVKASIYSRLARVDARQDRKENMYTDLDSAVRMGFTNFYQLDTLPEYAAVRSEERFRKIRDGIYGGLYPCSADPKAKEFDFWVGEWNVYQTGTSNMVGQSVIQKVAVGCAVLENWTSATSEGKSLNFIDPVSKKWKQVWIGSYPGGQQDFVNGEYRDGAMRFEYTSTRAAQGTDGIGRFTFFNQGPDQVRQFSEISTDGGKTWNTSYDFTYKRKR